MINILIADDHTMFVDGMESILKDRSGFICDGKEL
jgi:DNA-binding NarL/FixJ family response regulator